jgi:hypothetical protein
VVLVLVPLLVLALPLEVLALPPPVPGPPDDAPPASCVPEPPPHAVSPVPTRNKSPAHAAILRMMLDPIGPHQHAAPSGVNDQVRVVRASGAISRV